MSGNVFLVELIDRDNAVGLRRLPHRPTPFLDVRDNSGGCVAINNICQRFNTFTFRPDCANPGARFHWTHN